MAAIASLTDIPVDSISQIASQYSIPPSILQAVLRQGDSGAGSTIAGMTQQSLEAMGVDPSLQSDPSVIAQAAAAQLSQAFNQYGDWHQALSQYLTGSPSDYLSPTSAVGGVIWGILGSAASNPTSGMSTFKPQNQALFASGAGAFTNVLQDVFSSGGVTTQQHINDWHETSQMVSGTIGNTTVTRQLQAAAKNNGQSYSPGQCTWYAARSLGYIPGGLGNAMDWASGAADKGMTVNHTPTVGSAVVFGANQGGAGSVGHVAVVEKVNPDGTFVISEMNVDGQYVADQRTVTQAGVIGFIQPPAGTDMKTAVPGLQTAVKATVAAKPPAQRQGQAPASGTAGLTGIPDAPKPSGPNPAHVQQFAQTLQAQGIDPADFAANFPSFAASRRRLMQMNSDPSDYAKAVNELRSLGQPVTDQSINAYLNSLPHPTYPDLTVGAFTQAYGMATLHSVPTLGRTPNAAEVARLAGAGANWTQTKDFYGALATDVPGDQQQPTAQPSGHPKLSVLPGQQPQSGPQGQQPRRVGGALQ